jgi:hypothetical protein
MVGDSRSAIIDACGPAVELIRKRLCGAWQDRERRRNATIETAERIGPFSGFVRTRERVLGMIYMRGEETLPTVLARFF